MQNHYKKFASDVFLMTIVQWLPKFKAFLVLPFIAKLLGPEKYGVWSQLLTTLAFLYPFALLGLNAPLRRFLPSKNKEEAGNDFWAAVLLIFFNGIVLSIVLFFASQFVADLFFKTTQAGYLLRLSAILIPLSVVYQIFTESFVTFGQSKKSTILSLGKEVIEIGLIVYFLIIGKGLVSLILISILTLVLSLGIALLEFLKYLRFNWPNFGALKQYFSLGLPLFFGGIAIWLLYFSDRYILGYFWNIETVGIYAGIYNLCYVITLLSGPIYFVLLPTISKLWEDNQVDEVKKYLKFSFKYFFMLAIPAVFGLTFLSRQILFVVTTEEFVKWWFLMPIFATGFAIFTGFSIGDYIILLAKNSKFLFKLSLLSAILSIILNIVFVPFFGIIGAAINNLIVYCMYGIISILYSRKYLTFEKSYFFIFKSIAASLVMSLFLFWANPEGIVGLLIFIPAGAAIYLLALLLMRGFSSNELKLLIDVVKR